MTKEDEAEARLTGILVAMNGAIRTAQFDVLEKISAELETFSSFHSLNDAALPRLRRLAAQNTDCLEAAAQGLRAGRRRLLEIAAAGRADIYDGSGARQTLPVQTMDGVPARRL